jgi:hypothetical protein
MKKSRRHACKDVFQNAGIVIEKAEQNIVFLILITNIK